MPTRTAAILVVALLAIAVVGSRFTMPERKPAASDQSMQVLCRPLPMRERFERADLILTGSVFAVVPGQGGLADVLITPSEVLKGILPVSGVVIAARPTSAGVGTTRFNDLHFTSSDEPYFLVLNSRDDGRFDTSACDWSRLLGSGVSAQERHAIGQ